MEPILPTALVTRAIEHMNEDHAHNLLDYAHTLAGLTWAEDAEMTGLDPTGFDLVVRGGGRIQHVRLPFEPPLTQADQLRPALVVLAQRARTA
ncbi:MAG: DUF2470 domain-containing protein [Caldilineaceae bacterium]|nr:DUF2470 domain-containing protein [Caldilineaceae bacterium]